MAQLSRWAACHWNLQLTNTQAYYAQPCLVVHLCQGPMLDVCITLDAMDTGKEPWRSYALRHPLPIAVQAAYHHERFRTFPHVDSPARLIKELLKPRAGV